MGDKNSSLTRVIPLMDLLIKDTVNQEIGRSIGNVTFSQTGF